MTNGLPATILALAFALLPGSALPAVPDPFAHCSTPGAGPGWSRCYYEVARSRGAWREAADRLQGASGLAPQDPDLAFDLGRIRLRLSEFQTAAELLGQAADGFAAAGDSRLEGYARVNLAKCLAFLGRTDARGRELDRAEAAARAAGDTGLSRELMVLRAEFLRGQGQDLEKVLLLLHRAEQELRPDDDYPFRRRLLEAKGQVLRTLGRQEEALANDRSWAELAHAQDNKFDEATARTNMAVSFVALPPRSGAREKALRLAREALRLAEEGDNRVAEAKARELLGALLPGEEAGTHLRRCVALADQSGNVGQKAACLLTLAASLTASHPDQARSTLAEALKLALASGNPWTLADGWEERFRVVWATEPHDAAESDSLSVLDFIEALRRFQDSETDRADFFAGLTEVYYGLAGRLLKVEGGPSREDLEIAFAVAERMRARVLLDSLAHARAEPPAPQDGAGAAERKAVLRDIVSVQQQLQDPALTQDGWTALLAELGDLEMSLTEVEHRLGMAIPAALPAADLVSLPEVEAALGPRQALLAFQVGLEQNVFGQFTGGSWLLVVTRDGTRVYPLPDRSELEMKVFVFVGQIGDRDDGLLERGEETLYEDLLADALAELPPGIEELILVPDGMLHLLPFGLLRAHPENDPLIERFRLTAVPSATLWHLWKDEDGAAERHAALALADPAFPSAAGHLADSGDPEALDRQWALETGTRIGRLPYARREGRALMRRLGDTPSRLLEDEAATEHFLKSARLDEFGVIHFAAHALVDEYRPQRSAILLAAGAADEDGLLQPREIAALGLEGKLIVLSTCRSATGQLILGEGIDSLARAFFLAGARTVVANLWLLRDDDAAAFFDAFYKALARGESVGAAAAKASHERRAAGSPAAAWAGVVVLGDGDLVPVPGGVAASRWRDLAWYLGAGMLAVWLALVARRVKRRAATEANAAHRAPFK